MTSNTERNSRRFSWWWIAIAGLFIITAVVQLSEIRHRFYQTQLPHIYGEVSLDIQSISQNPPFEVQLDYDVKKVLTDSMILLAPGSDSIRRPLPQKQFTKRIMYDFPGFYQLKIFGNDSSILQEDLIVSSHGWIASVQHDYSIKPIYFPLSKSDGLRMTAEGVNELGKPNFSGTYWYVDDLEGSAELDFSMSLRWSGKSDECNKLRVVIYGKKGFLAIPYADAQCEEEQTLLINGRSVSFDFHTLLLDEDLIKLDVGLHENLCLITLVDQKIFEGEMETLGTIIGFSITTNQALTIEKLDIQSSDAGLQAAIL